MKPSPGPDLQRLPSATQRGTDSAEVVESAGGERGRREGLDLDALHPVDPADPVDFVDGDKSVDLAEGTASWRVAVWAWWTGPRAAVARAIDDNLQRLAGTYALLVPLTLAHVLLLQPGEAPATPPPEWLWKQQLVTAHGAMAVLSAALGIGLWLLLRYLPGGKLTLKRVVELLACATGLGFALTVVAIDQRVTSNITPFLVACLLAATLLRLRPGMGLLLYGVAGGGFWWGMELSQANPQLRLSNQVNGLTVVSIGWLVSVSLWQQRLKVDRLLAELRSSRDHLQQQQRRLRQLAVRDALTRTWNRSEFRRLAERELALGQRHLHDTSLILLDLDRFKHINDAWGHPVGDAVLVAAANVLREGVRGSDEVGRLGGEEFVVLLPQTSLDAAQALAERLRQQLEALQCPPVDVAITASFGVACLPGWPRLPVADAFERLYSAADSALYGAKRKGRNQVEVAAPVVPN